MSEPSVSRDLLSWFRRRRRDLPWRRGGGAYETWVSEIMLQQTRVAVVVPFYERFLERFPSVAELAAAEEEEVLRYWAGLGYYRRARMLHRAASVVCEELDGELPTTAAALKQLPGVGEYTSAAVASIAYGERAPVVDGNVKRVAARYLGLELASDARELHHAADAWGARLMADLPDSAPDPGGAAGGRPAGDLNQALMELGATVCLPRNPLCPECPVRGGCRAFAHGRQDELPRAPARMKWKELKLAFLAARDGDRVLLQRRTEGWNPGLYEPPSLPDGSRESLQQGWSGMRGRAGTIGAELGQVRHTITNHRIRARVVALDDWPGDDLVRPDSVPLTAMAKKILALLRKSSTSA